MSSKNVLFSSVSLISITITVSSLFILSYFLSSPFSIYSQFAPPATPNNNGTSITNSIDSMGLDKSGNIYLVDGSSHRIIKFDVNGHFIGNIGSTGKGFGQFSGPISIAIDTSGNIFVADSGNNRIQKFDGSGKFLTSWGSNGKGIGQFLGQLLITTAGGNNVIVFDKGTGFMQQFDGNGKFLSLLNNLFNTGVFPSAQLFYGNNTNNTGVSSNTTINTTNNQYKNFSIVTASPITSPDTQ